MSARVRAHASERGDAAAAPGAEVALVPSGDGSDASGTESSVLLDAGATSSRRHRGVGGREANRVDVLPPDPDAGRKFEEQVIEFATSQGWLVHHVRPCRTAKGWRTPVSGHPGFPDLVLARDGLLLAVELKTGKARLSGEQRTWHDELTRTCAVVRTWRPEDWDTEIVPRLQRRTGLGATR